MPVWIFGGADPPPDRPAAGCGKSPEVTLANCLALLLAHPPASCRRGLAPRMRPQLASLKAFEGLRGRSDYVYSSRADHSRSTKCSPRGPRWTMPSSAFLSGARGPRQPPPAPSLGPTDPRAP